jgi:hypothetical protein
MREVSSDDSSLLEFSIEVPLFSNDKVVFLSASIDPADDASVPGYGADDASMLLNDAVADVSKLEGPTDVDASSVLDGVPDIASSMDATIDNAFVFDSPMELSSIF